MSETDRLRRAKELSSAARKRPEEVVDDVDTLVYFVDDSSEPIALSAAGGLRVLSESHPNELVNHVERLARFVAGSDDPELNYDVLRTLSNVVAAAPETLDDARQGFRAALDVSGRTRIKELTVTIDALRAAVERDQEISEPSVRAAIATLQLPDVGVQRRSVLFAEAVVDADNPGRDIAIEGLQAALSDGPESTRALAALAVARLAPDHGDAFQDGSIEASLRDALDLFSDATKRETVRDGIEAIESR